MSKNQVLHICEQEAVKIVLKHKDRQILYEKAVAEMVMDMMDPGIALTNAPAVLSLKALRQIESPSAKSAKTNCVPTAAVIQPLERMVVSRRSLRTLQKSKPNYKL